ncbi:MAG: AI-2E family transporter [Ruminococcus sp.]|jgi:predicted PurR-regulated permease PerM|nr:AI-2E family transporter [Ruminococcus sp.]
MKIDFNRKYTTIAVYAIITFAICFGIVKVVEGLPWLTGVLKTVSQLLAPITWGIVFAFLMNPIMKFSERLFHPLICRKKEHKKLLRVIAVIISTIAFFVIIGAVVAIILPSLIESFQSIADNFYVYFNNIQAWALDMLEYAPDIKDEVLDYLNDIYVNWSRYLFTFTQNLTNLDFDNLFEVFTKVGGGAVSFLRTIMNAVIGIIIMVYLLFSKEIFIGQAKKITVAIFPKRAADEFMMLGAKLNKTLSGFLNGKIIDSVIIGVLCAVGMSVMKMEYVALISVIVGITNIIPFFGPFIGAIPSGLLLLIAAPEQVIPFVIFIFVLQQFDGNVLGPRILGDSTGLSAIWVMVAIFIGGHFGFGGMILGVPIFAVVYTLIKNFVESLLRKKGLATDTGAYMPTPAVTQFNMSKHKSFKLTKKPQKTDEPPPTGDETPPDSDK